MLCMNSQCALKAIFNDLYKITWPLTGVENWGKHAQLLVGFRLTRAALVGVNVVEHIRLLAAPTNGSKVKHAGLFLNVWTCVVDRWTDADSQLTCVYASLAILQKAVQEAADELNKQKEALKACNEVWYSLAFIRLRSYRPGGGGGTLGNFGWGFAAGTQGPWKPLTYTRASSSECCYPILE